MNMSIINSINLVLAAGGKCELYHPKSGIIGNVSTAFEKCVAVGNPSTIWVYYDLKILRYSFDHLCRAVEADPVDNPAVRALGLGYEASIINGQSIYCRLSTTDDLIWTIYDGFIIRAEVAFGLFDPFFSLIREGYPAGIPDEHWIDREKLEEKA